jgi:hypothetical protein
MTRDNVSRLELVEVGEGFRFDPDEILEAAKGQGFSSLVIIGEIEGGDPGEPWVSGTANAGETMILLERAKLALIRG